MKFLKTCVLALALLFSPVFAHAQNATPGTYTGYVIGTSQHYNPDAPAGSQSMAPASATSPGTFTYSLPFTVIVTT